LSNQSKFNLDLRKKNENLYIESADNDSLSSYAKVTEKYLLAMELDEEEQVVNIIGNLLATNLLFMDMISSVTGDKSKKEITRIAADFIKRLETFILHGETTPPFGRYGKWSMEDILQTLED